MSALKVVLIATSGGREIREEYDPQRVVDPSSDPHSRHPAHRVRVKTAAEAEEWGRAILRRFNGSRHPNEADRRFVSCTLEGAAT